MRLDHIAYRVKNRVEAASFFSKTLGYKTSPSLKEGFDIQFEDGSSAQCLVLEPPENDSTCTARSAYGIFGIEFHAAPEIFVSDGSKNSVVFEWVEKHGPGIHHLAYEVDSVERVMNLWKTYGTQFTTNEPLKCEGLVQAFTMPHPVTGMIYEIIERDKHGFCKENVRDLMESTEGL